jgi:energy-coupling factor transporter transmembrane protein EcfT
MNWMGHSMVWMIIVIVVISLNLSMIFLFSVSLPLAMAIFIGIFCYMTKQAILSRDMGKDNNNCNEMLLGSGIDYLRIFRDYEFKSKDYRSITSKMRREEF